MENSFIVVVVTFILIMVLSILLFDAFYVWKGIARVQGQVSSLTPLIDRTVGQARTIERKAISIADDIKALSNNNLREQAEKVEHEYINLVKKIESIPAIIRS